MPSGKPKAETLPHYSPCLRKKTHERTANNGSVAEKSCGSHKSYKSVWMFQDIGNRGILQFLWVDDIYCCISYTSWPPFLLYLLQLMLYSHTICMHSLKNFQTINLKTFELCNTTRFTPGMSRCIRSFLNGVTKGHFLTLNL